MEQTTKQKGEISESQVLAALMRAGYPVLVPFGDNQRYDLVFDDGEALRRVQVKTGRLRAGSIRFNCASWQRDSKVKSTYVNQTDYFGVYCPDTCECYLIPIHDCPSNEMSLRITPTISGQIRGTNLAEKYRI